MVILAEATVHVIQSTMLDKHSPALGRGWNISLMTVY